MGHVSLQYHVKHDDFFETVGEKESNFDLPVADWKHLSSFIKTPTRQGSMSEGGKFSTPLREEQSLPLNENNCTEAVNQVEHDHIPEGEVVSNEATQVDQLEDPGVIDKVPQENRTREPIGNTTRCERSIKLMERMAESTSQRDHGLVAWEVLLLLDQSDEEDKPMQEQQYELQRKLGNPMVFVASTEPDTMYYHQVMSEPSQEHFQESVRKEINDHESNHHWKAIPIEEVPKGTEILDMVWLMKRKRQIDTTKIYKWKAQLNVHGRQQEYGVNYCDTYTHHEW